MTTKFGMFEERDFVGKGDPYVKDRKPIDLDAPLNFKATVGKKGKVSNQASQLELCAPGRCPALGGGALPWQAALAPVKQCAPGSIFSRRGLLIAPAAWLALSIVASNTRQAATSCARNPFPATRYQRHTAAPYLSPPTGMHTPAAL